MEDQLQGFVKYLRNIKGLSDTTVYHYLTYHRYFKDISLTQKNINDFVSSKNNNCVCRAYLKAWLEYLKKDKDFELPKTRVGSKKKRLIRQVSKVEINKIRDYIYAHNKKDAIIFDLLYFGAIRRSEIISIKVNSFNWGKWFNDPEQYCEVNVIGKGDKERTVIVHPKAIKTLLNIYFERGILNHFMPPADIVQKLTSMDDPLFKKISRWQVWKIVKKYSIKAVERDLRTHEIRHVRATELEESGASIRDIQRYLGHSSILTTEIYLHSDEGKSLNKIKGISKNQNTYK